MGTLCQAWSGESIPVNKVFMRHFGYKAAVLMAVFISELKGREAALSHEKIREITGISYYMQNKIIGFLAEQGFLRVEKRGIPFRKYYKVNEGRLVRWLEKHGSPAAVAKEKKRRQTETEREAEMRAEMDPATLVFYDRIREDWKRWREYKRSEFRFRYRSARTEKIAVQSLMKISGADPAKAAQIIERSIAHGWKGLFQLPEPKSRPETRHNEPQHWDARKNFNIQPVKRPVVNSVQW